MNGNDVAKILTDAMIRDLESDRGDNGSIQLDYVYASGRHECVRAMALDLLHPEDRTFDTDGLARMKNGKERELDIIARVSGVLRWVDGVQMEIVEGQKRHEYRDETGRKIRSGKSEFSLRVGPYGSTTDYPVEIKSGEMARRCRSLSDLDRSPWTSKWIDQILSYLIDSGAEQGFMILDQPTLPLILPVTLSEYVDRAEAFRADALTAVRARFGEIPLPDPIGKHSVCRRCHHLNKSCRPPEMDYGGESRFVTDPEVIEAAAYVAKHGDTAREYNRANNKVKEAVRGATIAIVGDVSVEISYGKSTRYTIPKEVKEQYAEVDPSGRMSIKYNSLRGGPND